MLTSLIIKFDQGAPLTRVTVQCRALQFDKVSTYSLAGKFRLDFKPSSRLTPDHTDRDGERS
jgi:hypothetical protein